MSTHIVSTKTREISELVMLSIQFRVNGVSIAGIDWESLIEVGSRKCMATWIAQSVSVFRTFLSFSTAERDQNCSSVFM